MYMCIYAYIHIYPSAFGRQPPQRLGNSSLGGQNRFCRMARKGWMLAAVELAIPYPR